MIESGAVSSLPPYLLFLLPLFLHPSIYLSFLQPSLLVTAETKVFHSYFAALPPALFSVTCQTMSQLKVFLLAVKRLQRLPGQLTPLHAIFLKVPRGPLIQAYNIRVFVGSVTANLSPFIRITHQYIPFPLAGLEEPPVCVCLTTSGRTNHKHH